MHLLFSKHNYMYLVISVMSDIYMLYFDSRGKLFHCNALLWFMVSFTSTCKNLPLDLLYPPFKLQSIYQSECAIAS